MVANVKVVRVETGSTGNGSGWLLSLNSKSQLNIRDHALESARQTSNKLLETSIGVGSFHLKVKSYPYHVMREHALAAGAGADRFSSGMAHAFGKPIGVAARVMKGQTIFEVSVDKQNLPVAKQALERASKKLPCACVVISEKSSREKWFLFKKSLNEHRRIFEFKQHNYIYSILILVVFFIIQILVWVSEKIILRITKRQKRTSMISL